MLSFLMTDCSLNSQYLKLEKNLLAAKKKRLFRCVVLVTNNGSQWSEAEQDANTGRFNETIHPSKNAFCFVYKTKCMY